MEHMYSLAYRMEHEGDGSTLFKYANYYYVTLRVLCIVHDDNDINGRLVILNGHQFMIHNNFTVLFIYLIAWDAQ